MPKVYFNNQIIDQEQACISPSNPGFLHGVGLFETLSAHQGRPFLLDRHIKRMKASADKLRMSLGEGIDRVPQAIDEVLQANELTEARIRFTITPPSPHDPDAGATLLVAAQANAGYPAELYEKGMTVFLCTDYRQSKNDPLAGHKTTSYFPRLVVLRNAQDRNCGEALWFTPQNLLAEGCMTNVFLAKGGQLRTPALDTPILPGVTRELVIELATENGIVVEEGPCTVNDLLDADEVFLTNSIMQVMPVTRIEKKPVADEKPGPMAAQLRKLYVQYIDNYK